MSDSFGKNITLTVFGESHGPAVGAVLQGLAAGVPVDEAFMRAQMDKRRAEGKISTQRTEADTVRIVSGVYRGVTTGTALTLLIENKDTKSEDYDKIQNLPRPGHADYAAQMKYGGHQDARGGGHTGGRLTAPVTAAGSILLKLLETRGIFVATHLAACAGIADAPFCEEPAVLKMQMQTLNEKRFAVLDDAKGKAMQKAIEAAALQGDSVGGILETVITGLPAGLGEPFFESVESVLSSLAFSIPAVKGIEFGSGFALAQLRGSAANDAFCTDGAKIITKTNHSGGINGGITNGMPLVFRTAIRPTPSIAKVQDTVDLALHRNAKLQITGRHDPCIVHRARVVQDSMAALGIADLLGAVYGRAWQEAAPWNTD